MKKLLAAIVTSVPYVPNLLKLRNELIISDQRTLLKYLDFLEKAEVVSTLMQHAKGNKILQKPYKIYLGNTNYLYALDIASQGSDHVKGVKNLLILSDISWYIFHSVIQCKIHPV